MATIVENIINIVSTAPTFGHRHHANSGNTRALAPWETGKMNVLSSASRGVET